MWAGAVRETVEQARGTPNLPRDILNGVGIIRDLAQLAHWSASPTRKGATGRVQPCTRGAA